MECNVNHGGESNCLLAAGVQTASITPREQPPYPADKELQLRAEFVSVALALERTELVHLPTVTPLFSQVAKG